MFRITNKTPALPAGRYTPPGKRWRKIFLLVMLIGFIFNSKSYSQYLGTEWINYSQYYYKFPVTQTAIYHLDSTTLAAAGINVGIFDARNLQIFYHGQEIPLHVQGEADGVLNGTDFIEFYGEGNDGWLDSVLYINGHADMLNPAYSLANDTSFYYLTWNSSTTNLRFTPETDTNFGSYIPSPFYYYKVRERGAVSSYWDGELLAGDALIPEYSEGEGHTFVFQGNQVFAPAWTSPALNGLQSALYTATPVNSVLELRVATCNNPNSVTSTTPDHHHRYYTADNLVLEDTLNAYEFHVRNFTISSSALLTSTEPFRVHFMNDISTITRNAFGYYQLVMPQRFELGSRTEQNLYLPDDGSQPKSRLDITNYNAQSSTAWLYDLINNKRITVVDNAGTLQALVPNDGSPFSKKMYLSSEAAVINITQVSPVSTDPGHYAQFRDFSVAPNNDRDYLIITNRKLWASANDFATYRNGTGHNSIVIDINELYDQYSFGVRQHPNAIRNFLKMTNAFWTTKPEYTFLMGKGVVGKEARKNVANYSQSLVTTIGSPGSDNLFAYDITGNQRMYTAIGRLAAANDTDVYDYLNKVMVYEMTQDSTPSPLWQKNIVHMASDPSFQVYIDTYKSIIEDTLYGGHVSTFVKNGISPFPLNTSDSIRNLFNNIGVSLATVFGHSSGSGFDLTVDEPEQMNNYGKYPWYIVNGCLSGDLFQTSPLVSERYVLSPNKGAIGFIASTGVGFANILGDITSTLYRNISVDNYYETMGIAHREAISDNLAAQYWSLQKVNALNFQIHGDPALEFNRDTLPDIDLKVANVSFESLTGSPIITMELDSFTIKIIVNNLGKAIPQSYAIDIVRDFPQAGVPNATVHIDRPNGIYYQDTVYYTFPIDYNTSFGLNNFTITADIPSIHPETDDFGNNTIQVPLNITTTDIIPVYPHKFAVIPVNQTPLKASTGDPFAPLTTYHFEIDTTDLFNSSFKRVTTISQVGGVVEWNPGVLLPDIFPTDSTAYFWRVGIDSAGVGTKWKESTFQVITGEYGWGQDHFFQYKDDEYTYIDYNRPVRRFDFVPTVKELKIINYPIRPGGDLYNFSTQYTIDAGLQEGSGCTAGEFGLYVLVIDPITLEPWGTNYAGANPDHNFGNIMGCRSRVEKFFWFNMASQTSMDSLTDMLRNDVPQDYFIGLYTFTFNQPNFANFNDSLINQLTAMGADSLAALKASSHPGAYIFFTRKGDPSSTMEAVGTGPSMIQLQAPLNTNWNYGTIETDLIGPASEWQSFHWQQHSIDPDTSNDDEWVRIIGVDTSGNETILHNYIPGSTTDIYTLNSSIPAATYPYIKLFFFTRDDSTVTPSQMNHWHVMYEGVPECALDPNVHFTFDGDTSYQGENINLQIAIRNIGDYDMDSLQVRYFIVDANNVVHNYYKMKPPLLIGDTIIDTFTVSNVNYEGLNNLFIEANPYTAIHQLEQHHFNNIASRSMTVNGDNLNPLLDVTFDGVHIMDGDIVSAKPFINIQLKDENVLRLIDDTSDFELYLRYPGASMPTRIYFSNPWVTFIPANTAENYAKVEMRPDLTVADGKYELLLRAQDKSNNESGYGDSGVYDYKIRFEVINHSTITNIFNYPNPFSTSTQWVFTLTGSEIPTEFTIRIMTISGVVVREITLDELGPIHVGTNITNFKWNGTDEFGDKLATGVYIYQVITKINGENIDHRTTSADKYFKNNYGKLYILR